MVITNSYKIEEGCSTKLWF
ncbi:hypothetical protein F383_00930 [Gossypium arboreum]|uniref:Uncharacterized protein n=1 Tax=Gossypium arboreum TaxID=29729 RepID=A0A0B0PJE9_GOSAR|nr:hypothetical protein F383_00930 [Gossypium arboreum]